MESACHVKAAENIILSTCGCYIGKHGNCHHCTALAYMFLQSPATFQKVISKDKKGLSGMDDTLVI